ncbi:MAG TPA: 50S ribosomal protein L11 methyltransferase [Anaerolineae bacterium]|nr:50S ribosomal protein L11 methyltransferase [Anaerolineae bacterium]
MPDLLEFTLPVATADPESEPVQAAVAWLNPLFHGGVVVEVSGFGPYGESHQAQTIVRGYLTDTPENAHLLEKLMRERPPHAFADFYGEPRVRRLATEDWAEAWKRHYRPLRIGDHIVVTPSWEEPATQPGDVVVRLDPGMAFGTGTHPSTQLALRLLERYLRPRSVVLDVGTGSGILAIAAVKLGASRVIATDIDPEAVRTAEVNARLNEVRNKITLLVASVIDTGRYDLVLVNILADVIAHMLLHEDLAQRLAPDGVLILSGIIQQRREVVDLALKAAGLEVIETMTQGDWVALAARPAHR